MNFRDQWFRLAGWIKAVVVFVLLALATQLLDVATDGAVRGVWKYFTAPNTPRIRIAVLFGVLVVAALTAWYISYLRSQREVFNRLTKIDDSLWLLLPQLLVEVDKKRVMSRLLEQFVRDTGGVLDEEVARASILHVEGDYLVPLATYGMPLESVEPMRFYVGNDLVTPNQTPVRGTAGTVFIARKPRVVKFSKPNNHWVPDDQTYTFFEPNRINMPYKSFVALPLIIEEDNCIGVLCFDSREKDSFDAKDIKEVILPAWATRIAAAVAIYQQVISL